MTAGSKASGDGTPATQPDLVALFVSDVHLTPALPQTTASLLQLFTHRTRFAKQVYLLGDMFEYWVGDDDLSDPYHLAVADALKALTVAGIQVFWIAGNRDFLLGDAFAAYTGMQLLSDPCEVHIAGQHIILTHGDALCTDDLAYMQFRSMVRQPAWQAQFLSQPLEQRKQIVQGMRAQSRMQQAEKTSEIMDVNLGAVDALFAQFKAPTLIHGHTHRPALHSDGLRQRIVLPDWDCDNDQARGGWLEIDAAGVFTRCTLDKLPK
ncbi:UDP-2,3-diacylglucosamine diphosphatase [Undibacterium curvum]|uniref:UDP-2,3-diacylglucosamine hydrolase n=1 Tax=Undibacterium curvum TaxID=2762294 RepID=A0ABR7AA15_9BURK|nr:UDP-2,3-diacylglucosamine diphosphatase [Undibacterium curvum]MBC3933507.1 UDP-2,3-diacylglucosamine diphosphatase [Undibacterium curvum]